MITIHAVTGKPNELADRGSDAATDQDHVTNPTPMERESWSVEADDYATGMAQVRDRVPPGTQLLHVRVDR